jgi:hypothetical protein
MVAVIVLILGEPLLGPANDDSFALSRRKGRPVACVCADQGSLGFLGGNAK